MAVLKCKMCGGDIIAIEGQTYGTCDSCGSTVTLPSINDQRMENLFNRANHFRMVSEFDKAVATYEMILNEDNSNAEAHWGLLLSRYGVEYVEDPTSHERIPTCHRIQQDPILTDDDYLAAVQHAPDGYTRSLYEAEGKHLSELQRGLLQVSAQTEPFDIFICYKETTEGGSRTNDSALAQDIYYQLTNAGYKVFFSRVTLESMLGQQYEPHIFAALNSAKVMLAIGTKPEYFNAVWVKNEWSRFLALSKKDRSKVLIPCYRDMNVYDLPDELSMLQSQDMGKIGFMQDLLRGIEKVIGSQKKEEKPQAAQTASAPGVESLYKRATLFLEDGDFDQANEYFDRILDIDPEYAPAYMGKECVAKSITVETNLAQLDKPIHEDSNYKKAVRFANSSLRKVYESYNLAILYRNASEAMAAAKSESDYQSVAGRFEQLKGYEDSAQRAKKCHQIVLDIRAEKERELAEQKRQDELHRLAEQKRRTKNRKIAAVLIPFTAIVATVVMVFVLVIQPANTYKSAVTLLNEGNYDAATAIFHELGNYKDAPAMALESQYQKALSYLASKDYKAATEIMNSIIGYNDAATQVTRIEADKLFNEGYYIDAYAVYSELSEEYHTYESEYSQMYMDAKTLLEEGQYDKAEAAFTLISNYKDSYVQSQESVYQKAASLLAGGEYDQAADVFSSVSNYGDSATQILECFYQKALSLQEEGKRDEAIISFRRAGNHKDAHTQMQNLSYEKALDMLDSENPANAIIPLRMAGDYKDTKAHLAELESIYTIDSFVETPYIPEGKYGGDSYIIFSSDTGSSAFYYYDYDGNEGGIKPANQTVFENGVDLSEWTDVEKITSGTGHTAALTSDGRVLSMGSNKEGQCNTSGWTDVVDIESGYDWTIGLRKDGTVYFTGDCIGYESEASAWSDIVEIVSDGGSGFAGLKADGTVVWAGYWGSYSNFGKQPWKNISKLYLNPNERIGILNNGNVGEVYSSDDDIIANWTNITNIKFSQTEFETAIGLKVDGTVVSGDGYYYDQSDVNNWTNVIDIFAGRSFILGLCKDGKLLGTPGVYKFAPDFDEWTEVVKVHNASYGEIDEYEILFVDGTVKIIDGYHGSTDDPDYVACFEVDNNDIVDISTDGFGVRADGTIISLYSGEELPGNNRLW